MKYTDAHLTGWQAGRVGAKRWLRTVMSLRLSLRSHKEKRSDSCKLCPDLSTNAMAGTRPHSNILFKSYLVKSE